MSETWSPAWQHGGTEESSAAFPSQWLVDQESGALEIHTEEGLIHPIDIYDQDGDWELVVLRFDNGNGNITNRLHLASGGSEAAAIHLEDQDGGAIEINTTQGLTVLPSTTGENQSVAEFSSDWWGDIFSILSQKIIVGAPTYFQEVGPVIIAGNQETLSSFLSPGQCAIWFDATNGAAKLMFKAKQFDGTIKTGSVNVQT